MAIKFGAHLSIPKGYEKPLQEIKKIKGSCLQFFFTSPRSWKLPKIEKHKINQFISRVKTKSKLTKENNL